MWALGFPFMLSSQVWLMLMRTLSYFTAKGPVFLTAGEKERSRDRERQRWEGSNADAEDDVVLLKFLPRGWGNNVNSVS